MQIPDSIGTPLVIGALMLATGAVALVVRGVLLRGLERVVHHTSNELDDFLVRSVRFPSLVLALACALYVGLNLDPIPEEVRDAADKGMAVLLILAVTAAMANVLGGALLAGVRRSLGDRPVAGLGIVVVKGLIWLVGIMVLLNQLGLQITPLLTALGVGGLAMALALQDTLSNLFSGIHILLERPFEVGHWVQGENWEGRVVDISWRTTRILTVTDHYVVIPNSKIAGSTIQNFNLPDPSVRAQVDFSVAYGTDLDRASSVVRDELAELVSAGPRVFAPGDPDVRVQSLGDSAINLRARVSVKDYGLIRDAQDRMLRAIVRRLEAEGIEIPFPQRVVWTRQA